MDVLFFLRHILMKPAGTLSNLGTLKLNFLAHSNWFKALRCPYLVGISFGEAH